MKIKFKEQHKERISLLLTFSGIVLLILLITTLLAGLFVLLLINQGALVLGTAELKPGRFLLTLIVGSIVIGATLVFITLKFQLKPINRVLNAMNQLASGDYSVRLGHKGVFSKHPTVVEFSNSFNKMASELEQTEMLRSDFINNFSHEFKTPIVSIAGFAKVLKRGNLSEERKNEYLDIIEEESLRLSRMATNVMNLTKIENQTILTEVEKFNLSEQIRTCLLVLENKWSKKHLELALPSEEYYLVGNEELLKQVWINLFDNAIKFSDDGGTVEVRIGSEGGEINVAVSNHGEEIAREARDKIFKKFYQADESHASEGNGVGLAVVKKIVDLHGGTIGVECRDGTTTFTVSLPEDGSDL